MKDTQLLPYILPNMFAISNILSPSQFASLVLPSLKPLFAVKDPPQNMLTLLDNLQILQDKTEKPVFRERKYYLLSHYTSSTILTQLIRCFTTCIQRNGIRACQCKSTWNFLIALLTRNRSKNVLSKLYQIFVKQLTTQRFKESFSPALPCVLLFFDECHVILMLELEQLVFTKTRMLSVKIATLVTFLAMVKTLDQVCCLVESFDSSNSFSRQALLRNWCPYFLKFAQKSPLLW